MANFNQAYNTTAGHEAGWTVDNGGQTYKGISRKGWPNWQGWPLIDTWIRFNGQPKKGSYFNNPAINNLVLVFFKKNYWDKIMGDFIKNQTVANFLYDFYVNTNSAIVLVNKGLGARNGNTINEDSLKIINERPAFAYQVMYNLRKKVYTKLSAKPGLKKYSEGWFARLESFPKPGTALAGIGSIGAYSSREVYNILEKKGMPVLTAWQYPIPTSTIAQRYASITKGIDRIVRQFADAKIKKEKGYAVIAYNGGNGITKIALHTPGIYDVVYNTFLDAKIKYA